MMAMSGCCPFLLQSDVWEEVKHQHTNTHMYTCAKKHTEPHTQIQQTQPCQSPRLEHRRVQRVTSDLKDIHNTQVQCMPCVTLNHRRWSTNNYSCKKTQSECMRNNYYFKQKQKAVGI